MSNQSNLGFISRLKAKENIVFLICLVSAALVWLTIKLDTERIYELDVPTVFEVESSTVILSELPPSIKISLQGEIRNIMRFQRSMNKSKLELEILNQESLNYNDINTLLAKNLADYQLTLLRNHTGSIPLVLDSLSKKRVPIVNNTRATADEGFVITRNKLEPDHIDITGPSSFIFHVDSVVTNKLDKKFGSGLQTDSIDLLKSVSDLISFESDKVAWIVETKSLISYETKYALSVFDYQSEIADSIYLYFRTTEDQIVDHRDFNLSVQQGDAGQDLISFKSLNPLVQLDKYLLNSK